MITISSDVWARFNELLIKKSVPARYHYNYRKWLRYYLDFCHKYGFSPTERESLPHFIKKLHDKRQTKEQQKQAARAVSLYCGATSQLPKKEVRLTQSDKWSSVYAKLRDEIATRQYSPKTLKTYSKWIRIFQAFIKNKDPESLASSDVKGFLSFLAIKKKVVASTQNQAFNALLFLFRHVLKREFGELKDVVRAKRRPYIPVVLSRDEIDTILKFLNYPYDLVVKLLYGCGLRLFECLNLRIHNFNFDMGILTVHDVKGKKDRTVPLPEKIIPE